MQGSRIGAWDAFRRHLQAGMGWIFQSRARRLRLWKYSGAWGVSLYSRRPRPCAVDVAHLGGRSEEELTPFVDKVHTRVRKCLVKLVLQGDGVVGEEQGVGAVPRAPMLEMT